LIVGVAYVAVVFHDYNFREVFAAASGGAGSKHANIVWYHLVVLITEAVIIVALVAMRKYNGILKQRHRNNPDYTLSRSYQLGENEVFLRMFIPFAAVYTSFLCVYHLSQFFVRGLPIADVAVRVSIVESFYV
ncbi:hypothetical protein AAVH_22341, partial [Aphelenchoides avenae]